LKSLSLKQIELAKSADNRSGNVSDNYDGILKRTRDSLRDLEVISDLLPYCEKHGNKHKSAQLIPEEFQIKKFAPILEHIFQVTKPKGAPYTRNYMISWDTKPTSSKIKLANYLLSLASSYLIQSFSEEKSKYLHSRIREVIIELESNLALLDQIKELKDQIESYQEQTSSFVPTYPKMDSDRYSVVCKYCRENQLGKTVEDAITKLKHTEKCKTKDLIKDINIDEIHSWYAIIPPKNILEQFKFFNKEQH